MSKIIGIHIKPNLPPTFQKFSGGSGTYNKNYYFQIAPGNATVGDTYTNNSVTFTVYATVSGSTQVVMSGSGAPTATGILTRTSGSGDATLTFVAFFAPTVLRVRMVGGGGGGSGSGTNATNPAQNGGTGGTTTFGSSLLTSMGGVGGFGGIQGPGGTGGTGTVSSPAIGTGLTGGKGGGAAYYNTGTAPGNYGGGSGAPSPFGGGIGPTEPNAAGDSPPANTGSGGGAASGNTTSNQRAGGGGGAGGYVDALIYSPSATYSYAVGAAGTAGTAGTSGSNGGAAGSGYIEVTEIYT